MLDVVSLEEARAAVLARFAGWLDAQVAKTEIVPVERAAVRRIAQHVVAAEGVPPFNRSMVDGYAVVAADTFGCSDALPALLTLAEQIEDGLRPSLVIGVPVGFVNVVESKEKLFAVCEQYGVPAIAAFGRKGGSNVAAAVCNALLYTAADMLDPGKRGWQG